MIFDTANPDKLNLALRRFISRYPLFGVLLSRFRVEMGQTPTMAVGFDVGTRGAQFVLYFNPDFVEKIPLGQVEGVIHHEVRHVLYGHLLMTPDEYPDSEALVISQEVTVNEGIPEPLPAGPVLLQDYPELPRNEDTATRYRRLADPSVKPQQGESAGGAGEHQSIPLDDHGHWPEVLDEAPLARVILEGALGEIAATKSDKPPTEAERSALQSIGTIWGLQPNKMDAALAGEACATQPWQVLLRRFVGQNLRPSASFSVPPRRYPGLLGVVPGQRQTIAELRIQAVIDTSGSMTDEILDAIGAELHLIGQMYEVIIVECDDEILRVYPLRGRLRTVHGRGGTDFRPPFERVFLRKTHPDLILYFTDGMGPFPKTAPQVPTLWVLTDRPPRLPGWSQTIHMSE